jgi:membrane fusion protein
MEAALKAAPSLDATFSSDIMSRSESRLALFRQEAIEFQSNNRQWGQVARLHPLSTKLLTWFVTTAVVLIITFLFFEQYARKETVAGYLTPTSGTAKIFALQQGTIKAIHVREGEQVQEAQPLLTVETNQIAANGHDVNTTMLNTLSAQKEILLRQIAAEEQRTDSEEKRLSAVIFGLETEDRAGAPQSAIVLAKAQELRDRVRSVRGDRPQH